MESQIHREIKCYFFFHITFSYLFSSVIFFSTTQETLLLKAQITITKLFQYFMSLMLQNSREIRNPCKLLQIESTTVYNIPLHHSLYQSQSFLLPSSIPHNCVATVQHVNTNPILGQLHLFSFHPTQIHSGFFGLASPLHSSLQP